MQPLNHQRRRGIHRCRGFVEGGGSLSIIDEQGRHVAELKYEYWNGKQVVPWSEKEINEHGDRLVKAVNNHEKLVEALREIESKLLTVLADKEQPPDRERLLAVYAIAARQLLASYSPTSRRARCRG